MYVLRANLHKLRNERGEKSAFCANEARARNRLRDLDDDKKSATQPFTHSYGLCSHSGNTVNSCILRPSRAG